MRRYALLLLPLLAIMLLEACAILPGGKPARRSHVYLLETQVADVAREKSCEVVVVNAPEDAPGHLGAQMLYQSKPNQIERFAFSRWAASPAVMIEPLLLDALRAGNRYSAVLPSPSPVPADVRIENDNLFLIQRFEGESSFVELRMSSRAYAPARRRLVGSRDFSYMVPARQATPAAGVVAADNAVQQLLRDYIEFADQVAKDLGHDCTVTD